MIRQFLAMMAIGVLNLALFAGVFALLQNEKIYETTLGVISQNYERVGGWNDYQIIKTSDPYIQFENEHFLNWDAAIYHCISERMYVIEEDCYGNVRAAFFPLFPVVWKVLNVSPLRISLINYFLFVVATGLLLIFLSNAKGSQQLLLFALFISLPATIGFYIPYSESLFMLTMTVGVIGLIKKKYRLYFIGIFLMAMVRPATVFVLLAFLAVEFLILVDSKQYAQFLKRSFLKAIPFVLGFGTAILIQYATSGTWTALFDAREHWGGFTDFSDGFKDWSVEGFGLSVFSIIFICIPSLLFLTYVFLRRRNFSFFQKLKNSEGEYLFLAAFFYFIGITIFTFSTQGLDLHSFSRYILTSPLFFIAIVMLLNYTTTIPIKRGALGLSMLTGILFLFLNLVEFGGDKIQFSFAGLYLFVFTGWYLILQHKLPSLLRIGIPLTLIILNTVWNTYLLNMFMSNAWIFT